MKLIHILTVILCSALLCSQAMAANPFYLDDSFSEVSTEAEATYYYPPLTQLDEQRWALTLYYAGSDVPYMKGFYNGPSIFQNQRIGEYQHFHKSGALWIEGALDNEQRMHGLIRHHFDKEHGGGIQGEYRYQHGVLDGEQKVYHPNGQLSRREHRVNGDQRGVMETYSESGTLYSYRYVGEKGTEGEYRQYHTNGELSMLTEYQAGEKQGVERYYHENGKLLSETHYQQGKRHGVSRNYNDRGLLTQHTDFCAEQRCGLSQFYSDDGVLLTENRYNKQGQLLSVKSFNPQGELTQQQSNTYSNGKKKSVEERYTNGELVSKRQQDESKDWLLEEGYKDGKLISRYETLNNQRQGQFINTNWYGDLEEMHYRNGELHGKYRQISADTTSETSGQYQRDQKIGKWLIRNAEYTETEFYNNSGALHGHKTRVALDGTVLLSEHYQNGVQHGQSETRNADGVITSSGLYVNGKAQGRWIEPDPDYFGNNMLLWHGTYEHGVATGKWQGFSLRGHLLGRVVYDEQGRRQGKSYTFTENGQLRNMNNFHNDLLHGDSIMYLDGKPLSTQKYEMGQLVDAPDGVK